MTTPLRLFGLLFLLAAVVLSQAASVWGALIYKNTFTDLNDVSDNSSGAGTVTVSSDVASDGTTSLLFHSPFGLAKMFLTPTINGGQNTDNTITMVASWYAAAGSYDDYMQMNVNDIQATSAHTAIIYNHGYPQSGNLGVWSNATWIDSGKVWPTGAGTGWFTIALSLDTPNQQYSVYAAPGTSVNASDFVGTYSSAGRATTPIGFEFSSGSATVPDFYLDNVEIFSNLNEFSDTPPPNPGDVNLDGQVNQLDLNIVNSNFLQNGQTRATGDLNGDGQVNQLDLNLVNGNWLGTGGTGSLTAVPEPSAFVLLGLGASVLLWRRRLLDKA